jgi:hypothetical protein
MRQTTSILNKIIRFTILLFDFIDKRIELHFSVKCHTEKLGSDVASPG